MGLDVITFLMDLAKFYDMVSPRLVYGTLLTEGFSEDVALATLASLLLPIQ